MNIFSISSLIAFVTCVILATFVYFKNPRSNINKSFAILTFLIGIWTLFSVVTALAKTDIEAIFFARLVYIAAVLVPPTFLFFVFSLIGTSHIKKEKNRLRIFYLSSGIFLILLFSPSFIEDVKSTGLTFAIVPGPIYHLFFLFFALAIIFGYIKIFIKYKETTGLKKNQLIYVLIAFIFAGVAGFIHFISAYGVKEILPHDFLVILFTALVAYSIVKYRAMDVNLAIKRTMVYSLSSGLLTGFFIVLVLMITKLLSIFANVDSFTVSIFAALVIAMLFNPLRNKMQILVDKLFYKKTYDYYATIREVSQNLASMFDVRKIYCFVGDIIFTTLGLKNIYLLTAVPGGGYEVVYYRVFGEDRDKKKLQAGDIVANLPAKKEFRIDENSQIVKFLKTSDDVIIRDELQRIREDFGQETADNITNTLKTFSGEAVMRILIDNRLEVLLILGEKLSGDIFTDEDVNLLGTISNEATIALKNAWLYKEKVSSERLASVGMMSGTFAHEIRNPLTSIKIFAQLIPEKYSDPDFRESFSKIVTSEIARIDGLIKDLMDFSSGKASQYADNDKVDLNALVDLTALVDEILEYIKGRLKLEKKDICVEKDYGKIKINMAGDSEKLKQAFVNIINNSCHAMNGKGVLRVSINPNGQNVEVKIADSGNGISPEDITRIFDPFYTTKAAGIGVGLGLAISKKIIDDHGGSIAVESVLSKGTAFTISLRTAEQSENGNNN